MSRLPAKNSKSKGPDRPVASRSRFRAEWIGWGFWGFVEVTLLLLTVAAKWAGFIESQLREARPRRRRKVSGQPRREGRVVEEVLDE